MITMLVTRAALPVLRCLAGTEGISEVLAGELKPFGINTDRPGHFAPILGHSITMAANEMPEYTASSRKRYREANDDNRAGDPDKAIP
ncbi:hypothetical protein [Ancylobacter oerskovii]|uniref:Uncharacterized protein n=1 Tax=Ancylobacter oerskovii TaxID=459519 RepID=A0ABW4Z527_9HYPH|nr:hypothetical protein [Ancylobacter oerskovii]